MPPIIPDAKEDTIIINEFVVKEKLPLDILEIKYINKIYINPTSKPLRKPFCFIFLELIELPANILIELNIIITGVIVVSEIDVEESNIEKISSDNNVRIIATKLPKQILKILLFLKLFKVSGIKKPPKYNFV